MGNSLYHLGHESWRQFCPYFLRQRLELVRNISQNVSEEINNFLQSTDFETFYCSVIGFIVHCFPDMESEALNHFLTLSFTFVSNTLRQYGLKV